MNHNGILVIFRNDDFSADSDLELENEVFRLFEARNFPQTFGVVPFMSRDPHNERERGFTSLADNPAAVSWLQERLATGRIEIALHGCYHQTNFRHPRTEIRPGQQPFPGPGESVWSSYDPAGRELFSEFGGLDRREQFQRIKKGRDYLNSLLNTPVTTFIPPWNRYDDRTLPALAQNGFKVISGVFSIRRNSVQNVLDKTAPLLVEGTTNLETFLQALQQASAVRRQTGKNVLVVLAYHSWMFRSRPYQFRQLQEALNWLAAQPDMQVMTLRKAAENLPEDFRKLAALRAQTGCHRDQLNSLRRIFRLIPLNDECRFLCLNDRNHYARRIRKLRALKSIFYLLEAAVFFLIGSLFVKLRLFR